MSTELLKQQISDSILAFASDNFTQSSLNLFQTLGYSTVRQAPLEKPVFNEFKDNFIIDKKFDEDKARTNEWVYVDLLFQLTKEELTEQNSLFDTNRVDNTIIETYLFFAIELKNSNYTRSDLSVITREINKLFAMPAMILFKYNNCLTFSVINRRISKKDESKDVLTKISLIKDISYEKPHRAHIDIMFDLSLSQIKKKYPISNFVDLHNAWMKTLDIKELNKRFYKELFNWYLWAVRSVKFTNKLNDENDDNVFNAESVIRLITRLIFIWFIKEKSLVPEILFNEKKLKRILADFNPGSSKTSVYYRAILQNLFFATLNTPMDKDAMLPDEKRRFVNLLPVTNNPDFKDQTRYRYQEYFLEPAKALEMFKDIPFLNGGLFECLDMLDKGIRYDGFSSTEESRAFIPETLFFSEEKTIDLNQEYGTRGKTYKTEGIIHILNSYKFTITENTPLEEEIALDPELLGKVFENLLASYNPETKTTARKQTGSFYTPREIVNYMVDESLKEYLKQSVASIPVGELTSNSGSKDGSDTLELLNRLFSDSDDKNPFDELTTNLLIKSISEVKILDPACGSGAFPMGVLHRLVDLLNKLDPNNKKWNELQIQRAINETSAVYKEQNDTEERKLRLIEIEKAFDLSMNHPDYARKLYLIENCIYGVDIQHVAIQISKLRFFISLMVDQKVDDSKPNRNILSMPNLETKFVAANTLIGLEKPQQLQFGLEKVEQLEDELKSIRRKIFYTRKYHEKKALKKKEAARREELKQALVESGFGEATATQMAGWNPFDPMKSASFFDPETMFGFKDGFDIVIGNPPYIKEYTHRNSFDGLRESLYYQGKMDLWYLFACKNLDFIKKENGLLCFIATNNWTTNSGASKMRNKVICDSTIHLLLDFGSYMIFESADIQTMVMIFRNSTNNDNYNFELRRIVGNNIQFDDVIDLITKKQTDKTEYLNPNISKDKFKDRTLTFSNDVFETVLDKIKLKGNFVLNKNTEVAQGIVLPQDYLNKPNQKILGEKFRIGQGIFALSQREKEELDFSKNELELIKPYYTSSHLHKWFGNSDNDEWIIYTNSKFKHSENIKSYPKIKKHLDKFQQVITSDNKPYGLHRSREEYFFKGEKIIVLRKCAKEPIFTYTDFDTYVSATFYIIKSKRINQKYLAAVLNSKLIAFWLRKKGKMQGNNFQLDKEPLLEIPIYNAPENKQKVLIDLFDKILSIKQSFLEADITSLEHQINFMVYKLYELTYDEVLIIDPEFWMGREEYEGFEI